MKAVPHHIFPATMARLQGSNRLSFSTDDSLMDVVVGFDTAMRAAALGVFFSIEFLYCKYDANRNSTTIKRFGFSGFPIKIIQE